MSDLTRTQLTQITEAVRAGFKNEPHECKFGTEDRENIHELCRVLRGGGLEAIRDMIALSRQLSASKRAVWFVFLTATASGAIAIVVLGIKTWVRKLVVTP